MGRSAPGDSITNRLMSRADMGGLSRRRMVDGGEVFSGAIARKALRAVGARAMTVDRNIVVDDGFDPSKPEDGALYAHERLHQRTSGGEGGGAAGHNDAEEQQARTIERMVLHRMEAGESMADVLHDVTNGTAATAARSAVMGAAGNTMVGRAIQNDDKDRQAMEAYWHDRSKGGSHAKIVDDLQRHVMNAAERLSEEHAWRSGGEKDFLGGKLVR